jgi:hypothetical protein
MSVAARRLLWTCSLLSCAGAVLPAADAAGVVPGVHANPMQPAICMVVRTFWGHGGDSALQRRQGLRSLLTSLQQQSNPK